MIFEKTYINYGGNRVLKMDRLMRISSLVIQDTSWIQNTRYDHEHIYNCFVNIIMNCGANIMIFLVVNTFKLYHGHV